MFSSYYKHCWLWLRRLRRLRYLFCIVMISIVERRISYFICSQSEILWCCEPKHEKNLQFIFCQRLSYQRWLIISDLFWFLKAGGEVLIVIVMMIVIIISGKLLRTSKYEEEISDGHLGINEKELNSMNKHIPGTLSLSLLSLSISSALAFTF